MPEEDVCQESLYRCAYETLLESIPPRTNKGINHLFCTGTAKLENLYFITGVLAEI